MSIPLVRKKHSRLAAIFSPHLPSAHGAHYNDMVYPEFLDHLWQVPIPSFNNPSLLIVILFTRGIVVAWLKIIVLLINVWYIIAVTSILDIFLFIHIYYFSSCRYMYTWNERHAGSFILLVLSISCNSTNRSIIWRWWLLCGNFISRSYFLIDGCL